MTPRRQRMVFVSVVVAGVGIAALLALRAFEGNLLYFFTPAQVHAGEAPIDRSFRVGGLVVHGSVKRINDGVTVRFDVTDKAAVVPIAFDGILPDLFREGQGIIAEGKLNAAGLFVADIVLAKHDENYMPPDVAEALHAQGSPESPFAPVAAPESSAEAAARAAATDPAPGPAGASSSAVY